MLLHETYLEVIRAPDASRPNKDGKNIRTGSEVSVNFTFRSCPKEFFRHFFIGLHVIFQWVFGNVRLIRVELFVILDLNALFFFQ